MFFLKIADKQNKRQFRRLNVKGKMMNIFNASANCLASGGEIGLIALFGILLLIVAAASCRAVARQHLTRIGKGMETEFNSEGNDK